MTSRSAPGVSTPERTWWTPTYRTPPMPPAMTRPTSRPYALSISATRIRARIPARERLGDRERDHGQARVDLGSHVEHAAERQGRGQERHHARDGYRMDRRRV